MRLEVEANKIPLSLTDILVISSQLKNPIYEVNLNPIKILTEELASISLFSNAECLNACMIKDWWK